MSAGPLSPDTRVGLEVHGVDCDEVERRVLAWLSDALADEGTVAAVRDAIEANDAWLVDPASAQADAALAAIRERLGVPTGEGEGA